MSTKRLVQAFIAFVVICVIVGLARLALLAPARAQGWPQSEFRQHHYPSVKDARPRRSKPRREVRSVVIIRQAPKPEHDRQCMPPVSVVGDQAASQAGAHAQAEKSWQQEVRFRHGEKFADAENAREITYQCVNSSIRNIANRATEAVGINSQAKRCQMQATPCAAPRLGEGRQ